jgi:hypothetical protein
MLKWTRSDFKQCAIATVLALTIALLGCLGCWAFIFPYQKERAYALDLADVQDFSLPLRADVNLKLTPALVKLQQFSGSIECLLDLAPDPSQGGCLYRCCLRELNWLSASGDCLLHFHRDSEHSHHYRWAEQLSDDERLRLAQVLQLDLNETNSFADHSLLTESLSFFLTEQAEVISLQLSQGLLKLLEHGLAGSGMESFFNRCLQARSFHFPGLLAKGGDSWSTLGHLASPCALDTEVVERAGHLLLLESRLKQVLAPQRRCLKIKLFYPT